MRNNLKTLAGSALCLLSLAACSTKGNAVKDGNVATLGVKEQPSTACDGIDPEFMILSDNQHKVMHRINDFSLRLLRMECDKGSKVMSPVSVAYVLAMLANGADGDTRSELLATLANNGVDISEVNEALKAYSNMLVASRSKDAGMFMANSIVVNNRFTLNDTYVKDMQGQYDALVKPADFSSPSAVSDINAWCSQKTEGMIDNMVSQLSPQDLAVLLNAVYFNGAWARQFSKDLTAEEQFYGYTRDIKTVKMMQQTENFGYATYRGSQVLQMPYAGGRYCMYVLLPADGQSIRETLATLDAKAFGKMTASMDSRKVNVKMPTFTTDTEMPLIDDISRLGAPAIFSSGADFSRMTDRSVYVSRMQQKARIEVTENGTKAAAVTMAGVMLTSIRPEIQEPVTFHANRPFAYFITDAQNGVILFVGQYTGN